MVQFLIWYLLISIIGLITFPIIYSVLPFLADKGYAFSRIAGLLIWSYIFWILTTFGVLSNDVSGALISFILLILLGIVFLQTNKLKAISSWIRTEKKTIIIVETIFFIAFAFWSFIRAANPDVIGTEKPMELAFINSIMRSPTFPPNDPWLSGYAISYYYFGYVMVALLGHLTGSSSSIAFNLSLSAWFALTALGCYGVVYNLLSTWLDGREKNQIHTRQKTKKPIFASIFGPLFVLILSNSEGFLEMLHAKGLFWNIGVNGIYQSGFWSYLNIQELNQPPSLPFSWIPNREGGIWWWRASRVLQDFDITGKSREVIDEFPFFSYLLGDLHPHVLAMPFFLLAISLAINLFRGMKIEEYENFSYQYWLKQPLFWFTCLVCGGITFLNTWDFPVCLGLILITFFIMRIKRIGWTIDRVREIILAFLFIGICSIVLFLPFFLGFSSQAGGVLPSLNFFTSGINYWVMFLPFLVLIFIFLLWVWRENKNLISIKKNSKFPLIVIMTMAVLSYLLAWILGNATELVALFQKISGKNMMPLIVNVNDMVNLFLSLHRNLDISSLISTSIRNRLIDPITLITLTSIIVIGWAILKIFLTQESGKKSKLIINHLPDVNILIVLFIIMGAFLCLVPEFIYLRDVFGTRMNTIFKFYFQTWMIWGIAAATIFVILWWEMENNWGKMIKGIMVIVLGICLVYPFWALSAKTNQFQPIEWTLDGNAYLKRYDQDEYQAIIWMGSIKYGNIAEAVGGSYSEFARISTLSGFPTVLGWPGHELQWRGGTKEIGSRESDIELLYSTSDWMTAKTILERYNIHYVYIGNLERSKYPVDELKFQKNLIKAFSNESVTIYEIKY